MRWCKGCGEEQPKGYNIRVLYIVQRNLDGMTQWFPMTSIKDLPKSFKHRVVGVR
jgi:hypothetical protein